MDYELIVNKRRNEDYSILVGFFGSLFATILGIAYLGIIITMIFSESIANPSTQIQTIAAIVDLLLCPLLVVLVSAVHCAVPAEKRIFSVLGLIFSASGAVMVTLDRFIQITVNPYPEDTRSVMAAIEWFGFGFFLSLGLFFLSFALSPVGVQKVSRIAFIIYALLGLTSIVAYMADSAFVYIGYAAWGFVLYVGTGCLCAFFYGEKKVKEARNKIAQSRKTTHPVR